MMSYVVVVEFAEIDAVFAQIGGVDVEALELQHQLNGLGDGAVVLNQQNAHANPLLVTWDWNLDTHMVNKV